MWITINIILIILGVCALAYGKHIDSHENFEALFIFGFGCALIIVGIISSIVERLV